MSYPSHHSQMNTFQYKGNLLGRDPTNVIACRILTWRYPKRGAARYFPQTAALPGPAAEQSR